MWRWTREKEREDSATMRRLILGNLSEVWTRYGDLAAALWRCPAHTQLIRLTSFPAKFSPPRKKISGKNTPRVTLNDNILSIALFVKSTRDDQWTKVNKLWRAGWKGTSAELLAAVARRLYQSLVIPVYRHDVNTFFNLELYFFYSIIFLYRSVHEGLIIPRKNLLQTSSM